MSSIPPVAAIPPAILERVLKDPRVKAAAQRAALTLNSSADLMSLLQGDGREGADIASHDDLEGPSLFELCHSRHPSYAIQAYKQVATFQ